MCREAALQLRLQVCGCCNGHDRITVNVLVRSLTADRKESMLQVSELPPLIPLQTLFGNPAKTSAQVLFLQLCCAGRLSVNGRFRRAQ